jgi:LacI family transcriptional regulator
MLCTEVLTRTHEPWYNLIAYVTACTRAYDVAHDQVKGMTITIRDVAERADVSTATVSHVLNDTRYVSAETKSAVLEAVRALNYHPSAIARSLSIRKTYAIGMVASHTTSVFFGEMSRGVLDTIIPHNYKLLLCSTEDDPALAEEYFEMLLGRMVDGFITATVSQNRTTLKLLETAQVPVVFVDLTFEGMKGPFVGVDNEGGMYEAVSHLVERGHRQIGILAGLSGMSTMEERLAGYRRALRDHGIALDERLVRFCRLSIEEGRDVALGLLREVPLPTALVANDNNMLLGILLALQQLGLECPEDVALIGFDEHPWASVTSPAITVVRQPSYEIGRTAADILLKMLAGKAVVDDHVRLKPKFIVRDSCRGPVCNSS